VSIAQLNILSVNENFQVARESWLFLRRVVSVRYIEKQNGQIAQQVEFAVGRVC